jgi:serine/threonine-protein phosphatase 2A catalytic subunit
MSRQNTSDNNNLDRQIEQLMQCKPLPEAEIKQLCEKVAFRW